MKKSSRSYERLNISSFELKKNYTVLTCNYLMGEGEGLGLLHNLVILFLFFVNCTEYFITSCNILIG